MHTYSVPLSPVLSRFSLAAVCALALCACRDEAPKVAEAPPGVLVRAAAPAPGSTAGVYAGVLRARH